MTVLTNLGLGHICIIVKDMEKSLAFYRDVLGMEVIEDKRLPNDDLVYGQILDMRVMEHGVSLRLVSLFDGKTSLELQEWIDPQITESLPEHLKYRTTGLKEVAWNVSNLDKLVTDLEEKGYKSRTPIWKSKLGGLGLRNVQYFDPDGVTIRFTEVPIGTEKWLQSKTNILIS